MPDRTHAPLATIARPVFTPPPAEDPRPWIPPTPSGPKVAVVSPAEFLAAHPDIAGWSTTDHEVFEHLVEVAASIPTEPLSPAGVSALASVEAKLAALPVMERTPGPVAQVISLLHRRNLPATRRWRAERHLEAVIAERRALIGVAA